MYIEPIKAMLESDFPQPNALWNYSADNQFADNWLWATPIDVWGLRYSQFKQAVPGNGPFGLQTCTVASGPTQLCEPMNATMTTPGQDPAKLLIGHSDRFVDAMYDMMISAEVLLDVTTLTPPTGRFRDAMKDALIYLSGKAEGHRPVVRILVSDPPSDPLVTAEALIHDLALMVPSSSGMSVYVYVLKSSVASWNHAKIVAADGARAIVGGHNMWGPHYLGVNPVFDLSMRLTGTAARHAQDYASNLWKYAQWYKDHLPSWVHDATGENRRRQYAFAPESTGGPSRDQAGLLPDPGLYGTLSARFPAVPAGGSVPVLAVGRGGNTRSTYFFPTTASYLFPFKEPSDEAIVKLVSLAKHTVRMSVQTFQIGYAAIMGWNPRLLYAMADALNRGVSIDVVLSNPKAVAGGLGSGDAPYGGNKPVDVTDKIADTLTGSFGLTDAAAKDAVAKRLRVASIRYSTDPSYPSDVPIGNHAKSLIVDDAAFLIGSQNMYLSNLNEFGYIVEDATAARAYLDSYWTPLWRSSSSTATSDIDPDEKKAAQVGAMQFILALHQDTLLNKQCSPLLDQYPTTTDPAVKASIEASLDDMISSGGFNTTAALVLQGLAKPFFTETPPSTAPTPEAITFVINMMNDTSLMAEFNKAVLAPLTNVDAYNDNLTKFLKDKGYKCTALEVLAAFSALRDKTLAYWGGTYDTLLTADGGATYANTTATKRQAGQDGVTVPELGPPLVIDGQNVSYDGVAIVNPTYNDNVLSWTADGKNATSASLQFGTVTRPTVNDPFTGLECFGTITYPAGSQPGRHGTYSLYGRVAASSGGTGGDTSSPDRTGLTIGIIVGVLSLAAFAALVKLYRMGAQRQAELLELERSKSDFDLSTNENNFDEIRSPYREYEGSVLTGELRQRQVRSGLETAEKLAPFEGAMPTDQRNLLSKSVKDLGNARLELDNPPASRIVEVVKTVGVGVDVAIGRLKSIFTSVGTKASVQSRESMRESIELSESITDVVDRINEQLDKDEPFELSDEELLDL
jgi:phosphatidylserine/phosphatidylglycerophosphate/cardiolipin synthase-like enzyme